jgi:hypothetical protein
MDGMRSAYTVCVFVSSSVLRFHNVGHFVERGQVGNRAVPLLGVLIRLRNRVAQGRMCIGLCNSVIARLRDHVRLKRVLCGLRDGVRIRLRNGMVGRLSHRVGCGLRDGVRACGDDVAGGRTLFCGDARVRRDGATCVR